MSVFVTTTDLLEEIVETTEEQEADLCRFGIISYLFFLLISLNLFFLLHFLSFILVAKGVNSTRSTQDLVNLIFKFIRMENISKVFLFIVPRCQIITDMN